MVSFRIVKAYGVAAAATSACTAIMVAIDHVIHIPNISLLYIPVILFVAIWYGTWPSLLSATLAFLEYDFFLIKPLYTFTIYRAEDILAFLIFVPVAILTSQLAAMARERAQAAQRRAAESWMLYKLGEDLMAAHDTARVLQAITERIADTFRVDRCSIYIPGANNRLQLAAETVRGGVRDRTAQSIATWSFEQGRAVERTPEGRGSRRTDLYVPLRTADRVMGVLEVGSKRAGGELDPDERRLLTSFAAQAALVMARAQGDEERHRLELLEESDRLKSALLNAVSHDLRTPLSSIKASASALLLPDASWSGAERRELLAVIDQEADRLNRLVGNLLDLSRIEAGALHPVLDSYEIQEVLDTALLRLPPALRSRRVDVQVEPGLPPIQIDLVRVEELLLNLLDNAARYTPPDSPIEINARSVDSRVRIAVTDHGPGIPVAARSRVFEAFYRVEQHGDRYPGAGLGLAICRGIARALGGSIDVEETPGGGATFVLTLPAAPVEQPVS